MDTLRILAANKRPVSVLSIETDTSSALSRILTHTTPRTTWATSPAASDHSLAAPGAHDITKPSSGCLHPRDPMTVSYPKPTGEVGVAAYFERPSVRALVEDKMKSEDEMTKEGFFLNLG